MVWNVCIILIAVVVVHKHVKKQSCIITNIVVENHRKNVYFINLVVNQPSLHHLSRTVKVNKNNIIILVHVEVTINVIIVIKGLISHTQKYLITRDVTYFICKDIFIVHAVNHNVVSIQWKDYTRNCVKNHCKNYSVVLVHLWRSINHMNVAKHISINIKQVWKYVLYNLDILSVYLLILFILWALIVLAGTESPNKILFLPYFTSYFLIYY